MSNSNVRCQQPKINFFYPSVKCEMSVKCYQPGNVQQVSIVFEKFATQKYEAIVEPNKEHVLTHPRPQVVGERATTQLPHSRHIRQVNYSFALICSSTLIIYVQVS